ncbi:neuritin 1b [Chanos chanos]|uniref:Neuritin 1b n=1 Tax=Chanos chanos TaxID=29144 RepID=A0A6J2VFG5_CHACN|nr:neuritin-like [Chanos chanos]
MGLILTNKCNLLFLTLEIGALLLAAQAAGTCETVFKGFSDCLLNLGENMVSFPQELGDRENLRTICSYWDDFHSCATTAIADCQDGAEDVWEEIKTQSRSLNFQGSLFELCAADSGIRGLVVKRKYISAKGFITEQCEYSRSGKSPAWDLCILIKGTTWQQFPYPAKAALFA